MSRNNRQLKWHQFFAQKCKLLNERYSFNLTNAARRQCWRIGTGQNRSREMSSADQLILGTTPRAQPFLQELGPAWFNADSHGSHTRNDRLASVQRSVPIWSMVAELDSWYTAPEAGMGGPAKVEHEKKPWIALTSVLWERTTKSRKQQPIAWLVWDADRRLVPKPGVSIGRNCSRDSFDSIRWIYRGTSFSNPRRIERYAAHYRRDLCRFVHRHFALAIAAAIIYLCNKILIVQLISQPSMRHLRRRSRPLGARAPHNNNFSRFAAILPEYFVDIHYF